MKKLCLKEVILIYKIYILKMTNKIKNRILFKFIISNLIKNKNKFNMKLYKTNKKIIYRIYNKITPFKALQIIYPVNIHNLYKIFIKISLIKENIKIIHCHRHIMIFQKIKNKAVINIKQEIILQMIY